MDTLSPEQVAAEAEVKYFENYEIKKSDLETLRLGVEAVFASDFFEKGVLNDARFVTFDARFLYVFTKGEHASNNRFIVEEITPPGQSGLRVFKIPHSGFVGKTRLDYRGARSWLLCDELETTAVDAKKFPNGNVLYQPEITSTRRNT